jgi:drug/metabolite transporter (DMT)-like permease
MSLKTQGDVVKGAVLIVVSAAFFSAGGVAVRFLDGSLSPAVMLFWRNCLSSLLVIGWFAGAGLPQFQLRRLKPHLLRAALTHLGLLAYFTALTSIPLADAVLLRATGPLFVPVVAFLVYRHRSSLDVWGGTCIALLGVATLTGAGIGLDWGELIGMVSGLCGGAAAVSMWSMSKDDGSGTQMLWFSLLSVPISIGPLWSGVQIPDVLLWPDLLALAVFTLLSQVFMVMGFAAAPANRVIAWLYASAIFSAVIGYFCFNEPVTATMLLAFSLIIGGSYLSSRTR